MPLHFHYNLNNFSKNDEKQILRMPDSPEYGGVFLSGIFESKQNHRLDERLSLFLNRVYQLKLKTGIILDCFQGKEHYRSEYFARPMNFNGVIYHPDTDYYPVCPNNPIAVRNLIGKMETVFRDFQPDYVYLNHFQFPFNWEAENLDIQEQSPPYCYCPFCITEFSSVIGEIITGSDQIEELLPDWLEWRTEAILNLLEMIKQVVPKKTSLIVGLPPMAVIDLPFATGLLPYSIIDEGYLISPRLYHRNQSNKILWIEDILDQYQIDLDQRKIWPYFQIQNSREQAYIRKLENRFGGLIVTDILS